MIDMENERLLTPAEAARLIPPRHEGKPTHIRSITRWIKRGHQGVFLEAVKQPGGWLTSAQAVQRFLSKLAQMEHRQPEHIVAAQQRIEASRGHEEAMRRLREKGVID